MKNRFTRGLLLALSFFSTWRKKYREYATHCLTSGFIPRTFRPLQYAARILARLWLYVQVGRLYIAGQENLATPGRIMYCPNHSSMFDAVVLYAIMKRWPRYMTAYEEMHGLGGLKAIAMGAFGCFPVDRKHGKTVLEPAIDVIMSGQTMVLFPEGKISRNGQIQEITKHGMAIITNAAYERLDTKETVGIVPVYICYHKRDPATANGPYFAMGFKWRGGVTVKIGKPIYLHELASRKPEDITAVVSGALKMLSCPAQPGDSVLPDAEQEEKAA